MRVFGFCPWFPFTSSTFINGSEDDMEGRLISCAAGTALGEIIDITDSRLEIQNVHCKLCPNQNDEMESE